MKKSSLSLVLLATVFSINLKAATLVDNGFSSLGSQGAGFTSDSIDVTWDNFTLNTNVNINSASFMFQEISTPSTYFFGINADNTGGLGAALFSFNLNSSDVTRTLVSTGWYQYDFNLPTSVNLNTGTYWTSLSGDWLFGSRLGGDGMIQVHQMNGAQFQLSDNYIPFQLRGTIVNNTVPEPASLAFLGLGFAGMRLVRRKTI